MTKKRLTPTARNLRRRSTDAENRLWYYLRARRFEGAKFLRQFPVGDFVTDFACRDARLAIELDGGQHSPETDAPRTQVIEAFGYRVIRFWNNDVLENTEGVLEAIRQELLLARNGSLSPTLSPPGRGRICAAPAHHPTGKLDIVDEHRLEAVLARPFGDAALLRRGWLDPHHEQQLLLLLVLEQFAEREPAALADGIQLALIVHPGGGGTGGECYGRKREK